VGSLLAVMALFSVLHLILTAFFVRDLWRWLAMPGEAKTFLQNSMSNVGLFSPLISLAMSLNVLFGPMLFFLPTRIANHYQSLMFPALIFWGILCIILFVLEARILKNCFVQPLDLDKLNFGWLLDSFAFGMAALVGSGIASLSKNPEIAGTAALLSWGILATGMIVFIYKSGIILQSHFRAHALPDKTFLPSTFTIIPIVCLYAISFSKLSAYVKNTFSFNLDSMNYLIIVLSFMSAGLYFGFAFYLLWRYLFQDFRKDGFYPSQWGIVCALVGLEVLGAYAYSLYYPFAWIKAVNLISIVLAVYLYLLIWYRSLRAPFKKEGL
jgi:hypothetical protein